jgi:hypothetical protein
MHRFKLLGLALISLFAFAAMTAVTASAAHMTLPEFVTKAGYKGTSGAGVLTSSGGEEIKCSAGTNSGGMESSRKLGTFSLTFTGCEAKVLLSTEKCNTSGDAAGTILTTGTWHLVLWLNRAQTIHIQFQWLLVPLTKLECGSLAKIETKGNLLGEISPGDNVLTKHYRLIVNATATAQEFTEFENENGTIVGAELLSNLDGGSFGKATEKSENNEFETTADTLIIN